MRHNKLNIVNLIISGDSELKDSLSSADYSVNELPADIKPFELEKKFRRGGNNFTVLEITGPDILNPGELTAKIKFLYKETTLICFSEILPAQVKKILLKNGVSDCVTDLLPARMMPYIAEMGKPAELKNSTFLVLDDSESQINLIRSITSRFGYRTVFVSTVDELFTEAINPGIAMVLLNIGTSGIDLNGLVRRSFISQEIKKSPVVAYKCMEQGLFVHEIINGLNRLTKVILSPEELYCMLTDMLFKKEIASYTQTLTDILQYEKLRPYAAKTLQQIYYDHHGKPGSVETLFERDRIDAMITTAEKIKLTLAKAEGLIWLKQSSDGVATCGGAGV